MMIMYQASHPSYNGDEMINRSFADEQAARDYLAEITFTVFKTLRKIEILKV